MIKGRLPDEIINRSKKGFNMPVAYWLSSDLNELLNDMLNKEFIERQGLFEHTFIQQLISDHLERRKDNRKLLWTLLMFQLWLRLPIFMMLIILLLSCLYSPIGIFSERFIHSSISDLLLSCPAQGIPLFCINIKKVFL